MAVPFVDLNAIHEPIAAEISGVILNVLKSNDFIKSEAVATFEQNFANYIGVKYAVGCANGTDALELAIEVLNLKSGDEVIVPIHSWISTASAVCRSGAKPVFADTLTKEFTVDPQSILSKISPKTKAIIVVHLYGCPCRMDEIMRIAEEHNIVVIEDCAQAHGASFKGKKVGSFGLLSCFSFYPSKNLGAIGDGGAVLSDSFELTEKIRMVAHCGQASKNKINYIGRNSRLDTLQAAILDVKLKYLDDWNNSRRALAERYIRALSCTSIAPPFLGNDFHHVYHLFVVKTSEREAVINKFVECNIGNAIHYPFLLNEVEGLKDGEVYPNAYGYKEQIISLPMYANMDEQKQEKVEEVLLMFS